MNTEHFISMLHHAAERARGRSEFLGWVLARYEELEVVRGKELQQQLGVPEKDWPRLQLCLRPRPDQFLQDVTQIALGFGIDRAALAAVIRRVEAMESVRGRELPGSAGSLLAARTRKQKHKRQPPKAEDLSDD